MPLLTNIRDIVWPLFVEETRVARYKVLDASIGGISAPGGPTEVHGSEWAPQFTLPGIVASIPAALTFAAQAKEARTPFQVRVSTGAGQLLLRHTLEDTQRHTFHVVTRPNVLQEAPGAEFNEIIFSVQNTPDGRGGTVTFFDAVITYTSDKLTIRRRVEPEIQP